jgi:hypothetical protein
MSDLVLTQMDWKFIKSNLPKQYHKSWEKREAKLISKSDSSDNILLNKVQLESGPHMLKPKAEKQVYK